MKVSEVFRSIQGESTYAGLPGVFVRLSGCNLRCSYCDTKYALSGGKEKDVDEIVRTVKGLGPRTVTLTGGEPLLQREELSELARRLLEDDYTVLLETNGSLPVSGLPEGIVRIVDVKCPASGMSGRNLWENIGFLTAADEIKFVLSCRDDYSWAKEILRKLDGRDFPKVLFSPVWDTLPAGELAAWILDDGLNVRLQVQLHRIIFGPGRRS